MKTDVVTPSAVVFAALWLFSADARSALGQDALPEWFEQNRVQAHFENGIDDDLAGLYRELHPAIEAMGARVLTRIFKTTAEGAWWPTAAGYTHEGLDGRDLGRQLADHAHRSGLKVIAYYRIMCDDFVERNHPDWLCRDAVGAPVLEPRTRRRTDPADRKHVICFNSPARDLIQTRLLELADRGVDAIYFDSWHMPEICTCSHCRAAFLRETGHPMPVSAERGSDEYQTISAFVARTIVRNFQQWKAAVHEQHPDIMFAIGSSLYPCFERQMQITASLLEISDTSKTEFSKPFGGFFEWPVTGKPDAVTLRRRPFFEPSYAVPEYDLQNALGWSLTRDSCDGRPPLMWIPYTRSQQEALFSAAAAVSYGCVASIHPTGLWTRRRKAMDRSATEMYQSCYELGRNVSPWLAGARPHRYALIHISEASRNARIADQDALWTEFCAPILGAFETFKEAHLPVATINDLQMRRKIPAETRLLILPHQRQLDDVQLARIRQFTEGGGRVIALDKTSRWHLRSDRQRLKRALLEQVADESDSPPIRAHGPARMHAVFYRKPGSTRQIACLVNGFGWFRSQREPALSDSALPAPPACSDVTIEISTPLPASVRAREVVSGTELTIRRQSHHALVDVPEFSVAACVVIQ